MIIYPAVDILDGKCVRLHQGRPEAIKVYSDDPAEMASKWVNEGAKFLHVIDLNGAIAGEPKNLDAAERIVKETGALIQLGGGIRDLATLTKVFGIGVERVVLGTTVITQPEFVAEACLKYGGRVIAAIDARGGRVAISGWQEGTEFDAIKIIQELKVLGVTRFMYTDISTDGTLRGANIEAIKRIVEETDIPIIVSGGIAGLGNIKELRELEPKGVEGVIVGTALYEGTFTLAEAIEAAR